MRRRSLVAAAGALPVALLVVVAQATRQWADWGCAGVGGSHLPPCIRPAFWHWSDVDPIVVAIGIVVGAALAVALAGLSRRQRARRQQWGEL